MWHNEFESEQLSGLTVSFYEPLQTDAPENCHPYCWGIGDVTFYSSAYPSEFVKVDTVRSRWNLLGQRFTDKIDGWACLAPFVIHDGELYEIVSGKVIWRDGWCVRWVGRIVNNDDPRVALLMDDFER